MGKEVNVGIVGLGIYIPDKVMTAAQISEATLGVWSEQAVIEKLGIVQKTMPGDDDGTQEIHIVVQNVGIVNNIASMILKLTGE